jgi:hypothetical protein
MNICICGHEHKYNETQYGCIEPTCPCTKFESMKETKSCHCGCDCGLECEVHNEAHIPDIVEKAIHESSLDQWTLMFVAGVIIFGHDTELGTDGSHFTKKLRSKLSYEIDKARQEGYVEGYFDGEKAHKYPSLMDIGKKMSGILKK